MRNPIIMLSLLAFTLLGAGCVHAQQTPQSGRYQYYYLVPVPENTPPSGQGEIIPLQRNQAVEVIEQPQQTGREYIIYRNCRPRYTGAPHVRTLGWLDWGTTRHGRVIGGEEGPEIPTAEHYTHPFPGS